MFNPFKRKPSVVTDPEFNIYHPDLYQKVEVAFEAGGKKYFRFIDQYTMPTGRYKWLYAALREADLRMSRELLIEYLKEIKSCLKGDKNKVDLETIWRLIFNMETRLTLAFEPEGVKKLASICYFDDTEILTTWDAAHAKEKVKVWEAAGTYDFFLTRPVGELLKLSDSSITHLETYLREISPILEELNLNRPTPS